MDAFDADVLIYAAVPGHPLGRRVMTLFLRSSGRFAGVGSLLLLPELLGKPIRNGDANEVHALAALLARIDLRPVDRATAELATALASTYNLQAVDATHLATAVGIGADRFITNNQRDFPPAISELRVTYPADLPAPGGDPAGPPTVTAARKQTPKNRIGPS
jgi:predicted nucleic acid-binding protein